MFITVKKKCLIAGAAVLLLLCVLGGLVGSPNLTEAIANNKKLPIYYVKTDENKVALTFDAAWGADKTEKIMDALDEFGMKGTFFLVGFWVDAYPDMVKEINERGYLIGNHSTNHLHMNKLSESDMISEIETTSAKIENIVGYRPAYFRAPFGEYNNRMINYAEGSDFQVIQWSIDTLDWKGISGAEIADRVLAKVKGGDIILCHNNSDHILDALPLILLGLKNKGLVSVKLDELVAKSEYTIDNNGMQIQKT